MSAFRSNSPSSSFKHQPPCSTQYMELALMMEVMISVVITAAIDWLQQIEAVAARYLRERPNAGIFRPVVPEKVVSEDYPDVEAISDFRMTVQELHTLSGALNIPDIFRSKACEK